MWVYLGVGSLQPSRMPKVQIMHYVSTSLGVCALVYVGNPEVAPVRVGGECQLSVCGVGAVRVRCLCACFYVTDMAVGEGSASC